MTMAVMLSTQPMAMDASKIRVMFSGSITRKGERPKLAYMESSAVSKPNTDPKIQPNSVEKMLVRIRMGPMDICRFLYI